MTLAMAPVLFVECYLDLLVGCDSDCEAVQLVLSVEVALAEG